VLKKEKKVHTRGKKSLIKKLRGGRTKRNCSKTGGGEKGNQTSAKIPYVSQYRRPLKKKAGGRQPNIPAQKMAKTQGCDGQGGRNKKQVREFSEAKRKTQP